MGRSELNYHKVMGIPLVEFRFLASFAVDFFILLVLTSKYPSYQNGEFRKGLKNFTHDDDSDAEPEESSLNEEENDVPSDT